LGFEGNVNSDVGCNMIAFHGGCPTRVPAAGEVKVVCALTTYMFLADVLEKRFG